MRKGDSTAEEMPIEWLFVQLKAEGVVEAPKVPSSVDRSRQATAGRFSFSCISNRARRRQPVKGWVQAVYQSSF
jgi:hypothetical protein